MAKKKQVEEEVVTEGTEPKTKKKEASVEAGIAKQFGDNILVNCNYIFEKKQVLIPISPSLDLITGKIPSGSFVIFTGKEKVGKSTTSLFFAANAQNIKYKNEDCEEGRHVYYYNVEGRLKERDLAGIPHLIRERFHIIQSVRGKILSASDYLEIADQLINEKIGSIHIIDSYSALCTNAEKTGTMADMQRADGPKALAKFCRKVCNTVPINDNIVIGVTHVMGNPTGHSEWKEKSGQAIAYQSDVKLKSMYCEPWIIGQGGPQIGQLVHWQCINPATKTTPGQKTISYIRYGQGIDIIREVCELATDIDIIHKSGAWYSSELLNNQKAQGMENLCELVKNTPMAYETIYDKVKETFGV